MAYFGLNYSNFIFRGFVFKRVAEWFIYYQQEGSLELNKTNFMSFESKADTQTLNTRLCSLVAAALIYKLVPVHVRFAFCVPLYSFQKRQKKKKQQLD